MRTIFLLVLICLCFLACQKKTVPVIRERTVEPAFPVSKTSNIIPDTVAGKKIYSTRCSRCHDLPDPSAYTITKWKSILELMIPRARLNETQAIHLKAYLHTE
jgi:hypothetical protein